MKITIDLEDLSNLVSKADEIFLDPGAEKVLLRLVDLREQIEGAIDQAKVALESAALKVNPNFKSIRSDRVKVWYRSYGARFIIDESQIDMVPKELYKKETKVIYSVETPAIEKYLETHKGLPVGIIEKDRPKKITFDRKDAGEEGHGK